MRRVSSRQRLCAEDVFEANASEASFSDEDYFSCCDDMSSSSTMTDFESTPCAAARPPLVVVAAVAAVATSGRKRVRGIKNKKLALVFSPTSFNDLVDDVKLHICSFLGVKDACSFMATSKGHHDILCDSECLWKEWCYQKWPELPRGVDFFDPCSDKANLRHLLSLSSKSRPNIVGTMILKQFDGMAPRTQARRPFSARSIFRLIPYEDRKAVQFTGLVGTGDRCIRAEQPLPRPCNLKRVSKLMKFLRREHPEPRPFVSPFVSGDRIFMTPSLVSYYEITILERPPLLPTRPSVTPTSDCVAVGVSTKEFSCYSRMPGWDSLSYGYHGDDGGVFHASGEMQRRFGPAFGKGDTIGCGVDHRNCGIFFTLNGKFLGYAWENLPYVSRNELYPTVGIDTNCPIDSNFGSRAFSFDMAGFIMGGTQ